jgi:hypothetical protein
VFPQHHRSFIVVTRALRQTNESFKQGSQSNQAKGLYLSGYRCASPATMMEPGTYQLADIEGR